MVPFFCALRYLFKEPRLQPAWLCTILVAVVESVEHHTAKLKSPLLISYCRVLFFLSGKTMHTQWVDDFVLPKCYALKNEVDGQWMTEGKCT